MFYLKGLVAIKQNKDPETVLGLLQQAVEIKTSELTVSEGFHYSYMGSFILLDISIIIKWSGSGSIISIIQ